MKLRTIGLVDEGDHERRNLLTEGDARSGVRRRLQPRRRLRLEARGVPTCRTTAE